VAAFGSMSTADLDIPCPTYVDGILAMVDSSVGEAEFITHKSKQAVFALARVGKVTWRAVDRTYRGTSVILAKRAA
jgi:hypothetical protein